MGEVGVRVYDEWNMWWMNERERERERERENGGRRKGKRGRGEREEQRKMDRQTPKSIDNLPLYTITEHPPIICRLWTRWRSELCNSN